MEDLGVIKMALVNQNFWKQKKVFVTGHTGFKGGWICVWLSSIGASVKGYALPPPNDRPSFYNETKLYEDLESQFADIRDSQQLRESMTSFDPDILLHLAAQPLVRASYQDPVSTYQTNVLGTVNVLEAAKACRKLRSIVNITTDKCYANHDWPWGYREIDRLGGKDPYSNSKACSELVTSAYQNSYFHNEAGPQLASARAGNVIGGGDWATDRLIPDIFKAADESAALVIRNPQATRPWQHVLEPISGYLTLAERLFLEGSKFAEPWNFGPNDSDAVPVSWILEYVDRALGGTVNWHLEGENQFHETERLKLDHSKAATNLGWRPVWTISEALDKTIDWHSRWRSNQSMKRVTLEQIASYEKDC